MALCDCDRPAVPHNGLHSDRQQSRTRELGLCTCAANGGECYLGNSTGDVASLGVALHNLFHVAASMTAFVITAWVWAAFDRLLPIPAWNVAFQQACMLLAGNRSRVLTFSNDTHHHLHNFLVVKPCPAQPIAKGVSHEAM